MKKSFLLPVLFVFIMIPTFAFAAKLHCPTGCLIEEIVTTPGQFTDSGWNYYFQMKISQDITSTGCSHENLVVVSDDRPEKKASMVYSMALAAFLSGKKVAVYTNGCSSFGWPELGYLRIME